MPTIFDKVLEHAHWEANAMRSDKINIVHFFCGLTKIPDGLTCVGLEKMGYNPVIIRRKMRGLLGRPDFWIAPRSIGHSKEVLALKDSMESLIKTGKREISESNILTEIFINDDNATLFEFFQILEIDINQFLETVNLNIKKQIKGQNIEKVGIEEEPMTPSLDIDWGTIQEGVSDLDKNYESFSAIRTITSNMKKLKYDLSKLAKYQSDILIIGETGTGKELFARAIHQASDSEGPLVPINCGAIPRDLFESELFGHRKGSFSGAVADKKGAFELANYGTLFLDEIGELPIDLQPKLLRAIEYREIRPVGSPHTMKLNLKIVFATNRDLKKEVEKGNFREDLFFRISSPCLSIPPLRDRRDDVPILFNHFLEQSIDKFNKTNIEFSKETLDTLRRYDWPGNVRELKKAVEDAVMRSDSEVLCTVIPPGQDEPITLSKAADLPQTNKKEKFSDTQLLHWMKELDGQKNLVAEKLGVSYRTVLRRCKKLGL